MAERGKRIAVEGDALDRISSLPINVINQILDLLPIRVVAKTSVLSRKWKYIWASHPNIKIDGNSFGIKKKKKGLPQNEFTNIINRVLLQHIGPILKFSLKFLLPPVNATNVVDVSFLVHWLQYLSRNGIKELTLKCCTGEQYILPYHIYSATDLVILNLENCIFNAPNGHEEFCKLTTLKLFNISFASDKETSAINTPQLTNLMFSFCSEVSQFKIRTPKLKTLIIDDCYDVDFISFMMCEITTIAILGLCSFKETSLKNLFEIWRSVSCFYVDGRSFKLLTADTCPEMLPITTSCLTRLVLKEINWGDLHEISWIFHLLRSSTTLSRLEIECCDEMTDDEEMTDGDESNNLGSAHKMKWTINYLEAAHKMNWTINCLEIVIIGNTTFSYEEEKLFIKLLLSCSPKLKKMFIHEPMYLNSNTKCGFLKELIRFPRASTEAEIIFGPNVKVAISDISPLYNGFL